MLKKCIKLASKLELKKQRIYSIITDKRGRIIARGTNSFTKSHTRQAYYAEKVGEINKIFLHSEIASIIACKQQGYAIYTARVDCRGRPLPCAPCKICSYALRDANIFKIFHT